MQYAEVQSIAKKTIEFIKEHIHPEMTLLEVRNLWDATMENTVNNGELLKLAVAYLRSKGIEVKSRLDAGWKLPMIANALGHKDTRTTELYLRVPENARLVASKEYFEMYGSLIDEEETSL